MKPIMVIMFAILLAGCNGPTQQTTKAETPEETAKRYAEIKKEQLALSYFTEEGQHTNIQEETPEERDRHYAEILKQQEIDTKEWENQVAKEELAAKTAAKVAAEKEKKKQQVNKEKLAQTISKFSTEDQYSILHHKIHIGMTTEEVRLSWGRPTNINRTTYAWGTHEQWCYGLSSFVYFEHDVVTAIQN